MDFINDLLDFQINRLGYQFQNINLLTQALTQEAGSSYYNRDFSEKNKNYDSLCFVGEAVLKLVVSEYCIRSTKIGTGQEITWLKSRLLEVSKQNEIGEKLVSCSGDQGGGGGGHTINKVKILKIVKVGAGNLYNPAFQMGYHKIVKALFGAVFIDAGGSKGIGLEKSHKLFLKFWKPHLERKDKLKKLNVCFPSPKKEIHQFWQKNGINLKFIGRMEEKFGVKFKKGDILCEAVIQKSFYDPIRNDGIAGKMAQPDYERLEFLGDGVLGLIITEYVWNNYNSEKNVGEMVAMVTSLVNDEYQGKIFNKLGIREFVKMKRDKIKGWKKHGDLVESVVGAVFVDGGIFKARNFVVKAFGLAINSADKNLDLRKLEYKLNYSFKNKQFLTEALTFKNKESVGGRHMEQIGYSLLSLFLVDYKIRTCDTKADEIFLRKMDKPEIVKVSQSILKGIATYLNIRQHVKIISDDDDLGNQNWENYVALLFGAIWRDLTNANLYSWSILENVFYNVFNPYLVKSPKKSLLEKTSNGIEPVNLRNFLEIVEKLPYKFENSTQLYNVVSKKGGLLQIKLGLLGLHVIHFNSTIQTWATYSEKGTEELNIEKLVVSKIKDKLFVKHFIDKWTDLDEDMLTRILVGLIYADIKSKEGSFIIRYKQQTEDISWLFNFSL